MKRVLLVSPSGVKGGAERALAALARELPKHGYAPQAVMLEPGPAEEWLVEAGCRPLLVKMHRTRNVAVTSRVVWTLREMCVNADVVLAEKVVRDDTEIDDLYEQIFRELLTYMMEDSRNISRALKLIFIAKHLERVGDHSSNIAEMVVFMVRGQDIRHGTRVDRG